MAHRPAGRADERARRNAQALAGALLLLLGFGTMASADYAAPGPYQAGRTTVTVTRPQGGTFEALLFYPATSTGQGAPYDGSGAPYPAISFGHGWITAVTRYQSTLEHLATWGYFVIASESYGGLFPDHSAFADDLRWCLTYLETQHATPGSWLLGQVDVAQFGLSGHSMGGGASVLAAARDARVRVVANLAAAETNPSAVAAIGSVAVPVILVAGDEDGIAPPGQHTIPMYDAATAPRRLPLLDGGWHCGFLDSSFFGCDSGSLPRATQLALTRRLLTATFQLYLKDDQAAWRSMWGPELTSDPLVNSTRTDPGCTLTPAQAAAHGYGGATVTATLTLTNAGLEPTSFTLFAEDNAWPTTVTPAQTAVLDLGQSVTLDVHVTIPDVPGSASDAALVSARCDLDGGTRTFAVLTTQRRLRGDLDGDGSVGWADYVLLAACLLGPDVPLPPACSGADLDLDTDGDLHDFAAFQPACGS